MTFKELYRQRLSQGLCSHCGKKPLITKSVCQQCRDKLRERKPTDGGNSCSNCADARRKCYMELKREVCTAYGGISCSCCKVTEPAFLTIDHINNDGAKHRREVGSGWSFMRWLKTNNYPTGFQILCHNCRWGKRTYGECPHKRLL